MPDDQLGFRPFERNEQDPTPRVLLVKERRREVAPPGRWREMYPDRWVLERGSTIVQPRSSQRGGPRQVGTSTSTSAGADSVE